MVQRNLGWVIRDDAAGTEAGRIGADAREVVEPEARIEASRIVLDERELGPSHRTVEPARERVTRHRGWRRARSLNGAG